MLHTKAYAAPSAGAALGPYRRILNSDVRYRFVIDIAGTLA